MIDAHRSTHIFLFHRVASRKDIERIDVASSQEGQIIICEECGAQMRDGVIQSDGTIMFVCTRDFRHIFFARQNN